MREMGAGPALDAVVLDVVFGGEDGRDAPPFSTDIAASFRVVARMQERLDWVAPEMHADRMRDGRTGWCCVFGQWSKPCKGAFGETLPLAICRAALDAIEGQRR